MDEEPKFAIRCVQLTEKLIELMPGETSAMVWTVVLSRTLKDIINEFPNKDEMLKNVIEIIKK